ncbi:leucyl/phenylalanyl-tRNA--protein transferase [Roseicitreum antarcticum]|nr:leucyl/phenylalanyl-tRNA--protein transferase [Roseicitreum antarcticum]
MKQITPQILLRAYQMGMFPMAETRASSEIFWLDPAERGIMPLDGFRIARSLAKRLRAMPFQVSVDTAFARVVDGCAARPETWINAEIFDLFCTLHHAGHAHSIEVWDGPELVGGVYGLALGGTFCGESMFSIRRDASKVALAYLVDRLRIGGFVLFDTQFVTGHLESLGAVEIPRAEYHQRLCAALLVEADFHAQQGMPAVHDLLQRNTQTS